MGLEGEEFSRKKPLPEGLVLTPLEQEYFTGQKTGRTTWLCRRVVMQNAMTAPQLVAFIEQGLQAAGVRGKVVPPDDILTQTARAAYRGEIMALMDQHVDRLLNLERLKATLADTFMDRLPWANARQWVEEAFAENPTTRWRDGVETQGRAIAQEAASSDVGAAVGEALLVS